MQLKCEYTSFWLNLDSNVPLYCSNLDSRTFEARATTRGDQLQNMYLKRPLFTRLKVSTFRICFRKCFDNVGIPGERVKSIFSANKRATYVYGYKSNCLPAEMYVLTILVINKSSFGYLYLICACAIRNSFPLC